jgi:hypothetical protein
VRLTVSDGKGGTVSDTRPVTVGNMSGDWSGTVGNLPIRCSFQQGTDGRVTGTWSLTGTALTGTLDPAAINRIDVNANFVLSFKVTGGGGGLGFLDFNVENGRMDTTTGNTLNAGARGSGFNGEPFVLTRVN